MKTTQQFLEAFKVGPESSYLCFWGHHSRGRVVGKECLSQWYPSKFKVNNVEFNTAEHYMMCCKAGLFPGNDDVFRQILALPASDVKLVKALGRTVKNFDPVEWDKHAYDFVVEGNLAKFNQNPEILEFLLSTEDKVLVEASPYDQIWGIGLSEGHVNARTPALWQGRNLLGFALMDVRTKIQLAAWG